MPPDEPVAGRRVLARELGPLFGWIDGLVVRDAGQVDLCVRIEQREAECVGEIDREEAWRQPACRDFDLAVSTSVNESGRVTMTAMAGAVDLVPADGRETVIGGDEHVRRAAQVRIGGDKIEQLFQVGIRVGDARARGRTIDAGLQLVEAIPFIVLGSVRITRPEHQDKGFSAVYERGQYCFGGGVREPLLLSDVGDERAGGERRSRWAAHVASGYCRAPHRRGRSTLRE